MITKIFRIKGSFVMGSETQVFTKELRAINEEDIYLGEMTFYSGGGTLRFNPLEWDRRLGDKIQI